MNFNTITDGVLIFAIAATLILLDALKDLLFIFKKGVFFDQRELTTPKENQKGTQGNFGGHEKDLKSQEN